VSTHRFAGAAAAVVVFLWHPCASAPFGSPLLAQGRPIDSRALAQGRPFDPRAQSPLAQGRQESWRPTVVAQHGMVAAGHPLAPEGVIIQTGARAISPDGRLVAALQNGRIVLCPVEGGEPRALPGVSPGELPSGWSADGRSLYVFRRDELPTRVFRVDVATGRKDLWKEVGPSDASGVTGIGHLMITPDGVSYVYNYVRSLSDLYLVEGLK